MATFKSVETADDGVRMEYSTDELGELPQHARECLIDKSLCALISMKNRLPKTKSKLANSLRPCTVVAPYVSPLDALRAANELSSTRTPSVTIPHAKKRVYASRTALEKARKLKGDPKLVRAPFKSYIEEVIVDDVIAWIRSDPEGSTESLTDDLLKKCEKRHLRHNVYPEQLFSFKNLKRIKHRQITAEKDGDISVPRKLSKKMVSKDKGTHLSINPKTPGAIKPKDGFEIAIGVRPGENSVREQIDLTPEGLAGIKVSVSGIIPAYPPKRPAKTSQSYNERLRAVGQCKGLYGFFISRLTKATHNDRAVLVAANEQEKKDMITEVAEWVNSFNGSSAGDHPETAAAAAASAHSAGESTLQTVPRLQQELVNRCVGKARHITPFTLTDMLEASGYITVSDDQMVTYNLPKDRGNCVSWQQKTVEVAAASCKWSNLVKKAFQQRKRAGGSGQQVPKEKSFIKQTPVSVTQLNMLTSVLRVHHDYDQFDDDDQFDMLDLDPYDGDDDFDFGYVDLYD